jgi:RNA polymerase sigma factor (sigma-70 family)
MTVSLETSMSVSAEFDWDVAGDAELVGAAAAGDRAAFAGIYDRYADRLYDFCIGMVGHRDAADCVQEAFCMAVVDLPKLRDPDKLRPWLYAIARHQALRTLRARHRETASDELPDEPSGEAGPETLAARNELATLVAQAEGGISDRDREVLDLAYRHGLTGADLAQALGVSNESAKKMVQRLRDTVGRSLGALLIARQASAGHNRCPELGTIVADWDGRFTILVRKRISRHVESCANCDEHRGRLVNPAALLGGAPVLIPAPSWLRQHTLAQMRSASGAATGSAGIAAHAVGYAAGRLGFITGRFALWAAALVAVPAVTVAVVVGLPALDSGPGTPVQVGPAVPATSTRQQPTIPARESNVPAPEPNTPALPSAGPATADDPNSTNEGGPPIVQTPAPGPTAAQAPQESTVTAPSHVAPASLAPTPSARPVVPPSQSPSKPTVKHCPSGDTVAVGHSCPPPQAPAPSSPPQAPPSPNCPHIAVQGGPVCGRATQGH